MKILMIDNYDSFTYNLVYQVKALGIELDVVRNDKEIPDRHEAYSGLMLSPGPGIPSEAGQLMSIIESYCGLIPILGVCLGHQALAKHFGATIRNMDNVYHGREDEIEIRDKSDKLFHGVDDQISVGRYHSWIVETANLPSNLKVSAVDSKESIMAMYDDELNIHGVQFHPESLLTPQGGQLIKNFITICKQEYHERDTRAFN